MEFGSVATATNGLRPWSRHLKGAHVTHVKSFRVSIVATARFRRIQKSPLPPRPKHRPSDVRGNAYTRCLLVQLPSWKPIRTYLSSRVSRPAIRRRIFTCGADRFIASQRLRESLARVVDKCIIHNVFVDANESHAPVANVTTRGADPFSRWRAEIFCETRRLYRHPTVGAWHIADARRRDRGIVGFSPETVRAAYGACCTTHIGNVFRFHIYVRQPQARRSNFESRRFMSARTDVCAEFIQRVFILICTRGVLSVWVLGQDLNTIVRLHVVRLVILNNILWRMSVIRLNFQIRQ